MEVTADPDQNRFSTAVGAGTFVHHVKECVGINTYFKKPSYKKQKHLVKDGRDSRMFQGWWG